MPSIQLSKPDVEYLQKCAVEMGLSFGIIIGQINAAGNYTVVHLAKNCEEDVEFGDKTDDESEHMAPGPHSVEHIDTHALASQWISASKMCCGSFLVLGVFVSGVTSVVIEEQTFKVAKKLLYDVHDLLIRSSNFVGHVNEAIAGDYVFLAYSTSAKQAVCKLYNHNANGGTFSPLDYRTVDKPSEWYTFESVYEVDDIFPIVDELPRINIEHQFKRSIAILKRSLDASEIFLHNESVNDLLTVEEFVRKKRGSRKLSTHIPNQYDESAIRATIFLPLKCQLSNDEPVRVRRFNGAIQFSGVISSRIWCAGSSSLADVKNFIRDDILRSLAARIQIYCDGLTDPLISHEAILISEPPRRVYFSVPSGMAINPIQFSEYIFRGEAPTVAVAQAKQVLDVDINSESIMCDLEGLPEDDTFSASSLTTYPEDEIIARAPSLSKSEITRNLYSLGIAVALLVLLASVLLHFLFRQQ